MKYIRTLKNIERLFAARPNYITRDTRFGTEYIVYSDTRYNITVEKNDTNMWIMAYDRESFTRNYYDYFMTEDGWQFDQISSNVYDNKGFNENLKWDLKAIEDGHYRGKSYQEYELSKNDTKQLLDMVYTFTQDDEVLEIVEGLYENLDNLDASIVYKHTTIDRVMIATKGPNRIFIKYENHKWEAFRGGKYLVNLKHIPEIVTYVLYDNFNNPYLEQDRVRPLPENNDTESNDQVDTVESNNQTDSADQVNQETKNGLVTITGYQPEIYQNLSIILSYDELLSQAIKRAPIRGPTPKNSLNFFRVDKI